MKVLEHLKHGLSEINWWHPLIWFKFKVAPNYELSFSAISWMENPLRGIYFFDFHCDAVFTKKYNREPRLVMELEILNVQIFYLQIYSTIIRETDNISACENVETLFDEGDLKIELYTHSEPRPNE